MRWIVALLYIVLLICPCASCYGQTSFSSVSGRGGYAAMKGFFVWPLDNGLTLVPFGGFYRPSDREQDEAYAMGKAGVEARYEVGDALQLFANGDYVPQRAGFERISYQVGASYQLCYHCGFFKTPYLQISSGQVFYHLTQYASGHEYPNGFWTNSPLAIAEAGTGIWKLELQLRYEKLIKYTHRPPADIASYWTDIPFMTAIVQGFVSDISAGKVSCPTRFITPYGVWAQYRYLTDGRYMTAWAAGVSLRWGRTTLSGGVENFESRLDAARKNYFSFSASTEF